MAVQEDHFRSGLQAFLIKSYGLLNSSGFLETKPMRFLFLKSYFLYKRWLEDPFVALGKRYPELFTGGNILDVGANVGYTAAVFARLLSPSYKVFAFEPDQRNFEKLVAVAGWRGVEVEPVNSAVGAEPGELKFWVNSSHHGDHRILTDTWKDSGVVKPEDVTTVPVTSLDDFCRQRSMLDKIAFVKIDVQGYELAVCEGMRALLEANPTIAVAVEYMPAVFTELGFDGREVIAFFVGRGFQCSRINRRGELVPVSNLETLHELAEQEEYVDLLFRRQNPI